MRTPAKVEVVYPDLRDLIDAALGERGQAERRGKDAEKLIADLIQTTPLAHRENPNVIAARILVGGAMFKSLHRMEIDDYLAAEKPPEVWFAIEEAQEALDHIKSQYTRNLTACRL